jgi:predicted  nucleic acid-binding Zn-ribbon protein
VVENIFQKEQEIKEIEEKFSTKMNEMENLFRKERIDLLTKIQELEESKRQVVETKSKDCEDKLVMITQTVQNLKEDLGNKENKIKEQEIKIKDLSGVIQSRLARFHPGSNLKDKI